MDLRNSDSIEVSSSSSSNSRIKPLNALSEVFNNSLPAGTLKENLDLLEQHVRDAADAKGLKQPTSSAFSNTRGLWFEIIVAVHAWNYRITHGLTNHFIIKMPNVKMYDFRHIFDTQTASMLDQLERTIQYYRPQIRLTTTNPDLLIVRQKGLINSADDALTNLSLENLNKVTQLCNIIRGKCEWSSVRAGIGLTTSMRPDRRLQLVQEGNVLKSIFAHLRMRHWNNSVDFEYHGASSEKCSSADDEAFRSVASHSIVNVNSTPERAVDGIHSLLNTEDISTMLDSIIKLDT